MSDSDDELMSDANNAHLVVDVNYLSDANDDDTSDARNEHLVDAYDMSDAGPGNKWKREVELRSSLSWEQSCIYHLAAALRKLVDASVRKHYPLSDAVSYLNDMEDIPHTSKMYLDAFNLLFEDLALRERFITLPAEFRRGWLQRKLHYHYPARYRDYV